MMPCSAIGSKNTIQYKLHEWNPTTNEYNQHTCMVESYGCSCNAHEFFTSWSAWPSSEWSDHIFMWPWFKLLLAPFLPSVHHLNSLVLIVQVSYLFQLWKSRIHVHCKQQSWHQLEQSWLHHVSDSPGLSIGHPLPCSPLHHVYVPLPPS